MSMPNPPKLSKTLASLKTSIHERLDASKNLRLDHRKFSDIEAVAWEIALGQLDEAFNGFNAALGERG